MIPPLMMSCTALLSPSCVQPLSITAIMPAPASVPSTVPCPPFKLAATNHHGGDNVQFQSAAGHGVPCREPGKLVQARDTNEESAEHINAGLDHRDVNTAEPSRRFIRAQAQTRTVRIRCIATQARAAPPITARSKRRWQTASKFPGNAKRLWSHPGGAGRVATRSGIQLGTLSGRGRTVVSCAMRLPIPKNMLIVPSVTINGITRR